MTIFLIFLGGGLGSVLRYLCNVFVRSHTGNDFPFGIMLINISGSFIIGLTFSAFSLDAVTMINDGKAPAALAYIAASVILSIAAAFLGVIIAR
jgi:CrcB protein